jgi:hypothetical protein
MPTRNPRSWPTQLHEASVNGRENCSTAGAVIVYSYASSRITSGKSIAPQVCGGRAR